ncbi:MAG: hypothetical protein HY976_03870 [Candidatus Kerfeldbacteria bacterium]|nr:hypothetical protein [Candidatus Kerfeldbacteria bacterium]
MSSRHTITGSLVTTLFSLGVFVVLAQPGFALVASPYEEPVTRPGVNPVDQKYNFLNGSAQLQQKLGSLILGPSAAEQDAKKLPPGQLCLNGTAPWDNTTGTGNCITAWTQVVPTTGNFIEYGTLPNSADGTNLANYTQQRGAIQLFSTINSSSLQNPNVTFISRGADNVNASKAIWGRAFPSTFDYAGYLLGSAYVGNSGRTAQLCLNGSGTWNPLIPSAGHCITTWAGLIPNQVTNFLRLQSGTPSPDTGLISISQGTLVGSLTAGDASKLPAQFQAFTCGDGRCTTGESCSVDCSALTPVNSLSVTAGDGQVTGQVNVQASPSSPMYVLVVRQTQGTATFQPLDGSLYTVGMKSNNATVVLATPTPVTSTAPLAFTDTGLTNGTTYTYTAYEGNLYPRYSQPYPAIGSSPITATPSPKFTLTAARGGNTGNSAINGTSPNNQIQCGSTCAAQYASGTTVTLVAAPSSGYAFTGWSGGGCSGTGSCAVTVTANVTVTGTFQPLYSLTVGQLQNNNLVRNTSPAPANVINCGTNCSATFPAGTLVRLEAVPAAGYTFLGWSGGCTGLAECVVTLNTNTTVFALFSDGSGGGGGGGGSGTPRDNL